MQIIGRGATREEAFDNWKQAAKADVKERSEKIMALLLKVRSLDRKFVRTRIENTEYVCEGLFSGEYRNLANEMYASGQPILRMIGVDGQHASGACALP